MAAWRKSNWSPFASSKKNLKAGIANFLNCVYRISSENNPCLGTYLVSYLRFLVTDSMDSFFRLDLTRIQVPITKKISGSRSLKSVSGSKTLVCTVFIFLQNHAKNGSRFNLSYADPDLPHLNFDIATDKAPVPIIN